MIATNGHTRDILRSIKENDFSTIRDRNLSEICFYVNCFWNKKQEIDAVSHLPDKKRWPYSTSFYFSAPLLAFLHFVFNSFSEQIFRCSTCLTLTKISDYYTDPHYDIFIITFLPHTPGNNSQHNNPPKQAAKSSS